MVRSCILTYKQRNSLPGCYYKDSDYCFLDDHSGELSFILSFLPTADEGIPVEGDYIDLIANPELFTGYSGPAANRIWSTIYSENCFGISELDLLAKPNNGNVSPVSSGSDALTKGQEDEEQCLEKRVYYKIISGELSSSIT